MIAKNIISAVLIVVMLALVFSCAPATSSTKETAVKPAAVTTEEQVSRQVGEWEKTLKEAKKEGKINLYTSTGPIVRQALVEGFSKRTGIEVLTTAGRGPEVMPKILSERRAGLYLVDVYIGGTTPIFFSLKPEGILRPIMPELFLPEVLDTTLWYKGELPFMDKDKLVMQTRYMPGGSQQDVAFMRDKVSKAELVSWYDLLKPEFKSKMNMQDVTVVGKGSKWINKALTYYGLDWDYFRALIKQEPVLIRDKRIQVEQLVRGKYLLSINPDTDSIMTFQKAGANLDTVVFKETRDILGGASSGAALLANPPHPNASKLFINWFLSKEGQTVFSRSYGIQSAREDTPTDHLPQWQIRKPNADYPIETEEFILQEPKQRTTVLEIFGPLLR